MKSFNAQAIAVVSALAGGYALTVNTPNSIATCVPVQLSWTGSTSPPYYCRIVAGNPPLLSSTPVISFALTNDMAITWNPNLTVGTQVVIIVSDNAAQMQNTAPVTIIAGPSTSCVGTATGGSGSNGTGIGSGSGTSTGAAGGTGTSSGTSTGTGTSSNTGTSSRTPTNSASSAAATSPSAAAMRGKDFSSALGALGLLAAAVGLLA